MKFQEMNTQARVRENVLRLPLGARQMLMDVLAQVMLDPAEGEDIDIRVQSDSVNGLVQITLPIPIKALTLAKAEALALCEVIQRACAGLPDASPDLH